MKINQISHCNRSSKAMIALAVFVVSFSVLDGVLLDSQSSIQATFNLSTTNADVKGIVNDMWRNLTAEINQLRHNLDVNRHKQDTLQRELESKNDDIFFLKENQAALNQSLQQCLAAGSNTSTGSTDSVKKLNQTISSLSVQTTESLDKLSRMITDEARHLIESVSRLNASVTMESLHRAFDAKRLEQAVQRDGEQHTKDYNYLVTSTSTDIRSMTTVLEELRANFSSKSCGNDTQANRVMFTATMTLQNSFNPVVFQAAPVNMGLSYNTSSGVFTCPVSGMYYFIVHLAASTEALQCSLVNNGTLLASTAVLRHPGVPAAGSASTFVHLQKGDTVFVGSCSTGTDLLGPSLFSGTLMFAD